MPNAKQEWLTHHSHQGKNLRQLFAGAQLKYEADYDTADWVVFSAKDYDKFLEWMDFIYDDGWGNQELYGFILFNDGTWFDRHEYDGSERWEYRVYPTLNPNINEDEAELARKFRESYKGVL